MHLGNVLVTDDLHVVLCDFGGSYVKPDPTYFFNIGPPLPYTCPDGYYGQINKCQDIFGFGVLFFIILSKRYPHCPTSGFAPSIDEFDRIFHLHQDHKFDALPEAILHESSITFLESRTSPALTCCWTWKKLIHHRLESLRRCAYYYLFKYHFSY